MARCLLLVAAALLALCAGLAGAACPHAATGLTRSSTLGWTAGQDVVINAGQKVLVDANTPSLGTVTVRNNAELILDNPATAVPSLEIKARLIKVESGGKVRTRGEEWCGSGSGCCLFGGGMWQNL